MGKKNGNVSAIIWGVVILAAVGFLLRNVVYQLADKIIQGRVQARIVEKLEHMVKVIKIKKQNKKETEMADRNDNQQQALVKKYGEIIVDFETTISAAERNALNAVGLYQSVAQQFVQGSTTIAVVRQAVDFAIEQCKKVYSEVGAVPDGLPLDISQLLGQARAAIEKSYRTKAEAFYFVHRFLDTQSKDYLARFKEGMNRADGFRRDATTKIFQAKAKIMLEQGKEIKAAVVPVVKGNKVEGIIYSEEKPTVIIGGKLYVLNEEICGGKIIAISPETVTISFQENVRSYGVGDEVVESR